MTWLFVTAVFVGLAAVVFDLAAPNRAARVWLSMGALLGPPGSVLAWAIGHLIGFALLLAIFAPFGYVLFRLLGNPL